MGGSRFRLRSARVLAAGALVAGTTLALGACSDPVVEDPKAAPATASSSPTPVEPDSVPVGERLLSLRFDGGPDDRLRNTGAVPFDVAPVVSGGGTMRHEPGPRAGALRLPAYDPEESDYAVVRVTNAGEKDWLRPGNENFAFGASFSLDRASAGSDTDDGDNLIQRGLFDGPSIYKLQLDRHRLSCLVRGMSGEVLVEAPGAVDPGQWYRARCVRRGDAVSLAFARMTDDGPGEWTVVTKRGPIGSVIMPAETPLSIGGKLGATGSLASSSTDQFNGAIDGVFFRLVAG